MSGQAHRVLLLDGDRQRLRFVARGLREAGYEVDTETTPVGALMRAARPSDAVIVDVDQIDGDGRWVELCREIRARSSAAVILLSSTRDEREIVAGLDAGADDFVTTPVGLSELLARLRAVLRRTAGCAEKDVVMGDLKIDLANSNVFVDGDPVQLTRTQFRILRALARRPGSLVTREALAEAVWGVRHRSSPNLIHVHISQLRRKLERDPASPRHIVTEHGSGFRLVDARPAAHLQAA